jgi:Zn-dependent protease/predicted transcriptional regulator
MKWSFEVTKLFGIPLRIHLAFLLLLVFVAMAGAQAGEAAGALNGVLTVVLVFGCVAIHELAHSLVAMRYGVNVRAIVLLPIGGVSQMDEIPEDAGQEVRVSLVGPLTSLVLALLFYLFAVAANQEISLRQLSIYRGTLLPKLFVINLMLGLFNILPAFPMDGGRVLRGILSARMDHTKATKIAVDIGQAMAILMFFFGIFFNWWLALIAVFIYLGAESEEHRTILRAALRHVPVSRAMLTNVEAVSSSDSLSTVVKKTCHSLQTDFPVIDGGLVVGVLPKEAIFAAIDEKPPETLVSEIMTKEFPSATREDTLDSVFRKMESRGISLVPILDQGSFVGMISLEQIGKYHMMCKIAGR